MAMPDPAETAVVDAAIESRRAMRAQHRRNFEFFGAPVGMIFTIDRRLGKSS